MQPFSFEEFLLANGKEALITFIRNDGVNEIPKAITEKLTDYLKLYFVVGGMPSAVKSWLETRDYSVVEVRQRDILETYENDSNMPKKTSSRNCVIYGTAFHRSLPKKTRSLFMAWCGRERGRVIMRKQCYGCLTADCFAKSAE